MSRKVCFYIMRKDTGFAPNPDHDFCTLAACTPNHTRGKSHLHKDDYLVGCFRGDQPPHACYVMKIDEVLTLDRYYRDGRFEKKKPSREYREGDNIYYYSAKDEVHYQDTAAHFHRGVESQCQDVTGNRVFIGMDFAYLGDIAVPLPAEFVPFLPHGPGIRYLREDEHPLVFEAFLKWRPLLGQGKRGAPRHPERRSGTSRVCPEYGRPRGPIGPQPCRS